MNGVTLGVDLATASARCVALDTETGRVLAAADAPLPQPVRSLRGSSTQRPVYAESAGRLMTRVCFELGDQASAVTAVCISGTSGTVVPCDARGVPIGDALLYDDTSGAQRLAHTGVRGRAMLGRVAVLAATGRQGYASHASTADVVAAALVGSRVAGDTSHWLKAGIDASAATWPSEAVAALGIAAASLPALVHPGTLLGVVDPVVASACGLPDGVVVVAGMTDGCTAQIATGAVRPGDTVGVLGTTLVLKAVSVQPVDTADGAVYSHLSPDGLWWAGGASNVGAGVLAAEFPRADLDDFDRRAAERPSTVVRYPLTRAGERFPVSDPGMVSVRSGDPEDELDAYRAVLDGVAFTERLGLERLISLGVAPRRHVLAGGASKSSVWNRIRATVLTPLLPVWVAPAAVSAVGAALLAAHAVTEAGTPLSQTTDRLVAPPEPVETVAAQYEPLEAAYQHFVNLVADATPPNAPEGAMHHA